MFHLQAQVLLLASAMMLAVSSSNLKPIYRMVRNENNNANIDHFYTIDANEATNSATSFGYAEDPAGSSPGSTGYMLSSNAGCPCASLFLRLYHGTPSFDFFYTIDANESQSAVTNFGYTAQPTAPPMYCVKKPGQCGAFRPLYRFESNQVKDHFYTSDSNEASHVQGLGFGYSFEVIACYIWDFSTTAVTTSC